MNGWRENLNRELLGLSQKLHCTVNQYAKFNTDKTYNVDTHKVQCDRPRSVIDMFALIMA